MGPDIWECILRLALSALFGGIVGLERELRLKGAGIRTHLIVSFASCMMMLVSKYGFSDLLAYESVKLDPSRRLWISCNRSWPDWGWSLPAPSMNAPAAYCPLSCI